VAEHWMIVPGSVQCFDTVGWAAWKRIQPIRTCDIYPHRFSSGTSGGGKSRGRLTNWNSMGK